MSLHDTIHSIETEFLDEMFPDSVLQPDESPVTAPDEPVKKVSFLRAHRTTLIASVIGLVLVAVLGSLLFSEKNQTETLRGEVAAQVVTIDQTRTDLATATARIGSLETDLATSRSATTTARVEANTNRSLALQAGAVGDQLRTCVTGFAEVASSMLGSYLGMPNQALFDRVMDQCGTAIDAADSFSADLSASLISS